MNKKIIIWLLGLFITTLFHSCSNKIEIKLEKKVIEYIRNNYDSASINYFKEIAFGSEYGTKTDCLMKWSIDTIDVYVKGKPSLSDKLNLINHINTLNKILLYNKLKICDTQLNSEITIYFLPIQECINKFKNFSSYFKGMFQIYNDDNNDIVSAYIVISTSESLQIRKDVLLEELTQSLGLMNDSYKHTESLYVPVSTCC